MKGRKKAAKKVPKHDQRIALVAARIASLRKQAGYTSSEKFAFEHELSRSTYAKAETGVDMRLSSLLRILDLHGITLKQFFSEGFD